MEWWYFLKAFWAIAAIATLSIVLIIVWRARGLFNWQKSLKAELKELKTATEQNSLPVKNGIKIIEDTCVSIFHSFSPNIGELRSLPLYIRSIAACFHPNSDCPELQISMGSFLQSLENSLDQFDRILRRRGFKSLRSISIRKIKKYHRWYERISESVLYKWFFARKKTIQQISKFRFFLFFDPLAWLAYLSRRLTTLVLIKYLMVDLYIFIGKLAIEAYASAEMCVQEEGEKELEAALEELDALGNTDQTKKDPRIQAVRDRLVSFSSILIADPTFQKWQGAVREAADIISITYFPDSDFPLEEAALGPLLDSARTWAARVSKGKERLFISRLYDLRLETIYKAKNFSNNFIPKSVQKIIKNSYQTYGWLKWPLKVYRSVKRVTPWKISLEVGWAVSKKAGLAYIHGKTFDMACEELNRVYRLSRFMSGPTDTSSTRISVPADGPPSTPEPEGRN
jgi:hypothetical protein